MNELIEKIEALPSKGVIGSLPYKSESIDHLCTISDLKSLAAALTLANKKIELLQASNDHYADEMTWAATDEIPDEHSCQDFYCGVNDEGYGIHGFDFARKNQEEIARLEGSNAEIQTR